MQTRQNTHHSKTHSAGDGYRETDVHRLFRHGACADLLHLLGQHVDGRLSLYDEPTHQHSDGYQQPAHPILGQLTAQHHAHGGKAYVDTGEEQNQAHIGKQQTGQNSHQRQLTQLQEQDLENQEEHHDGSKGNGHFQHIFGDGVEIRAAQLHGVEICIGHGCGNLVALPLVEETQYQNGQNRTDRTQSHQTETVGLGIFVASDGCDTDAQRHNEGDGHRTGGHTAGVECHAEEAGIGESCQNKDDAVEEQQQPAKLNAQQDAQHTQQQKEAYTYRHRQDQHSTVDVGHIVGQHLQIRLGDGDDHAQQEADREDQQQLAGFGQLGTDVIAHRGHRRFCAVGEETET